MAETVERCAGCGIGARLKDGKGGHPWVGVMNQEDASKLALDLSDQEPSTRGFVHVPVCDACHRDPEHRIYPLKAHFFPRDVGNEATRIAGATSIGGA